MLLHAMPPISRAAKRGVSNAGVSRSGLVLPFLSFLGLSRFFPGIFPICSGMVRGFSRLVLFLFLGLFSEHLRGTVPKGSATQSGPFPKKVGNTRVWKPPGLASLNYSAIRFRGKLYPRYPRLQGLSLDCDRAFFCRKKWGCSIDSLRYHSKH